MDIDLKKAKKNLLKFIDEEIEKQELLYLTSQIELRLMRAARFTLQGEELTATDKRIKEIETLTDSLTASWPADKALLLKKREFAINFKLEK